MLNWLFPRTVSDILKRFHAVIDDLEQHAADKIAERERHFTRADVYTGYAQDANAEWIAASTAAANFRKLLSIP